MTDFESSQISSLSEKIDELRSDVRDTLAWINGSPGVKGAREEISLIKQQLKDSEAKSAGRVTWAQCLLCGSGLIVVQVILNYLMHFPK